MNQMHKDGGPWHHDIFQVQSAQMSAFALAWLGRVKEAE